MTVKENVPAAVGVPEITPVVDNVNPAGKLPVVTAQVYGETPPVATRDAEYATPILAAGSVVVVIVNSGSTVTAYACVTTTAGDSESAARTVKVTGPATVGVPEITPVDGAIPIPVGNAPTEIEYVYGATPPDATTVVKYASPTSAFGIVDGASVTVPGLTVSVNDAVALS